MTRIGIAGPSCSGKSTVARLLAAGLGATRLCLDDFYLKGHARRHVAVDGVRHRSFEHPEAYDGDALLSWCRSQGGPVVAEGFLLFLYPGAEATFDRMVFIDLPWDEVVARRTLRKGQTAAKVDASFAAIGRSEWELFGARQRELPGLRVLDGRLPVSELLAECEALVAGVGVQPAR